MTVKAPAKRDLLVIDDEPALCKTLSALFSERGFTVETAKTAQEARERIGRKKADVVLLDLKLPDSSGLDVLSELKASDPEVRVVVISAFGDPSTVQEALQRGANGFLAKPFDFDQCFYAALGISMVDLAVIDPEPEALARVPVEVARTQRILPLRMAGGKLQVATIDPLSETHLAALRERLGCEIEPVYALGGSLEAAIARWYGGAAVVKSAPTAAKTQPTAGLRHPEVPPHDAEADRVLRSLIQEARSRHASDLHLGVGPNGLWLRERVDGTLHDMPVPPAMQVGHDRFMAHLRALTGIAPSAQMQHAPAPTELVRGHGRCSLECDEDTVELRVSILPATRGSHAAIQIVEPSRLISLERLGLSEEQRGQLEALLARPNGLILVTGPAACGKSVTLYAVLERLRRGRSNVVTIEHPVEQELPGVTQVPVKPEEGMTFAEGLRGVMYHDPDAVMVSDLPDAESARLAVRLALTGRLVLGGLHTNDAASVITRLLDYEIEPFFLCSTLSGILAQRLVRKLCEACREASKVTAQGLQPLGVEIPKQAVNAHLWRAKGCRQCRQSGFQGFLGLYEFLPVDHHIRSLIIKRAPGAQIRQSAMARGMTTLSHAGWKALQSGTTSLEELLRVLPPELR